MKRHQIYVVPLWTIALILICNGFIIYFISPVDISGSIFTQRKSLLTYGIDTREETALENIKNRIILFSYGIGLFAIIPHYFSRNTVFSGTLWNPLVCASVVQIIAVVNIMYGGDGSEEVISDFMGRTIRMMLTGLKGCTIYDFYSLYNDTGYEWNGCNFIVGVYEEQDDIYAYYRSQVWIIKDIYEITDLAMEKGDKLTLAKVVNEVDNTTWWLTYDVWHGNHTIWETNVTGYKKIHVSTINARL